MNLRLNQIHILPALAALTVVLSGCGSNKWLAHANAGQEALSKGDPASLQLAEKEFGTAIQLGAKECATAKEYSKAIVGMGETLFQEGKFEESQWYLIRGLQLATAVNMPPNENVKLLKDLVVAYEQTRNYEEALNTQNVLLNFLAVEQSPTRPEFARETENRDRLKVKLASVGVSKAPASAGVAQ